MQCKKFFLIKIVCIQVILQANFSSLFCQCFTVVPLDQRKITRFHCTTHCQPLNYRNDRDSKGKDVSSSDIDMNLDTSILNNDNDNNDNGNNTSIRTAPNAANGMQGNLENIGGDPDVAKICEKQLDYVGAGTLGDIMSDPSQDDDDEKIRGDRDNHDTAAIDIDDETKSEGRKIIENQYVGAIDVESATGSKTKGMPADLASEAASRGRDTATKIKSGPTKSGLVTSTGGTLTAQYGVKVPDMSPLDRIALTANGNLQRIFSSFYDAPVHVHVDRCVKRESCVYGDCGGTDMNDVDENQDEAIWDRIVHLSVFDQMFCKATSVITVHSHDCIKIVESGEVGIGQLFRYLDKLPTFSIVDAGRCEDGGLWRQYRLECTELTCDILEEFVPNAWKMKPDDLDYFNEHDNTF